MGRRLGFLFCCRLLLVVVNGQVSPRHSTTCYNGLYGEQCFESTFNIRHGIPTAGNSENLLDLRNRGLKQLPVDEIRSLPDVKFLILGNNSITDLCDSGLSATDVDGVIYLDLSGNNIESLCLDEFTNLKVLKLETDVLSNDMFIKLKSLDELHLKTSLGEIPVFRSLANMTKLSLNLTTATSLPNNLFRDMAPFFKTLIMSGPKLSIQSKELLMNLSYLRYVHLMLPGLETIPSDTFYDSSNSGRFYLRSIIIEGVKQIPENIFQSFKYLINVRVSGFEILPDSIIKDASSPQFLKFTHGHFDNLTGDFRNCSSLKEFNLSLSHNVIEHMASDVFQKCKKLIHLDLSESYIGDFDVNSLSNLPKLQHLDLMSPTFCQIPIESLTGLDSLKVLKVNLTCRDEFKGIFANFSTLERLEIEVDNVELLPNDTIKNLPALRSMKINNIQMIGMDPEEFGNLTMDKTGNSGPSYFNPPDNDMVYVIVSSGRPHCDCRDGFYAMIRMNADSTDPERDEYCINKDDIPAALLIECDPYLGLYGTTTNTFSTADMATVTVQDEPSPTGEPTLSHTSPPQSPTYSQEMSTTTTVLTTTEPLTSRSNSTSVSSSTSTISTVVPTSFHASLTSTTRSPPTVTPTTTNGFLSSTLFPMFPTRYVITFIIQANPKTPEQMVTSLPETTSTTTRDNLIPEGNPPYLKWAVPVGIIVVVLLFTILICFYCRYRERKKSKNSMARYSSTALVKSPLDDRKSSGLRYEDRKLSEFNAGSPNYDRRLSALSVNNSLRSPSIQTYVPRNQMLSEFNAGSPNYDRKLSAVSVNNSLRSPSIQTYVPRNRMLSEFNAGSPNYNRKLSALSVNNSLRSPSIQTYVPRNRMLSEFNAGSPNYDRRLSAVSVNNRLRSASIQTYVPRSCQPIVEDYNESGYIPGLPRVACSTPRASIKESHIRNLHASMNPRESFSFFGSVPSDRRDSVFSMMSSHSMFPGIPRPSIVK